MIGKGAFATHAGTMYVYRNNMPLKVLYHHLCRSDGVGHDPALCSASTEVESFIRNKKIQIVWNYDFRKAVFNSHWRPDIVFQDFKKRKMFAIEFSVAAENVFGTRMLL